MKELLNPKSVALIGATDRVGSVGLAMAKNLLSGKSRRKIFFINPGRQKILGQKCFSSILDIKEKIDLAIIAVPQPVVKQVSRECCSAKVGLVIIISSGFAEAGKKGQALQKEIARLLKQSKISLIGPNCLGVIKPSDRLNASFAPDIPRPGQIAFLSQSGALIDSIIDYAILENFGFSLMVSYGNEAGLGLNDFLSAAEQDKNTKVIAVYAEEIKNGREFIKIASKITKQKPIIILKGGKTPEGKKAVQSHTASLAGEAKIYSAAFKKAGIIEVETIRDLFLVSRALSSFPRTNLSKIYLGLPYGWAILTNGGAVGVLTTDWCSRFGVKLAKIPPAVFQKIGDSQKVNLAFSKSNPLDIIGDASSAGYQAALLALLAEKSIGGVIFCQTLQAMTDAKQNAQIIIKAQKQYPRKPILPLFLGGSKTKKAVDLLKQAGLGCFPEPRDAALAASWLLKSDLNSN